MLLLEALALLPDVKPRLAKQTLDDFDNDFSNEHYNAYRRNEPWAQSYVREDGTPLPKPPDPRRREPSPGLIITPSDLEECFKSRERNRVTPAGAILLIRMYEAGLFELRKKRASPGDPVKLRAYANSLPEILEAMRKDEEARQARALLIDQPERITEQDFTYSLLNSVFIRHHGLQGGSIQMRMGGLLVTKGVFSQWSNSGKSHDSDVTFSWVSADGTAQKIQKKSLYANNRHNDPDRNWGLGRE
ncbi:hypothetical protein HRD49_16115 [Corallococcus exiguus]|uniref:hypothetical protein n=1 Tax=Corallococcus exiguus TaxID=83462 RepID=UPI001560B223|nr:hypothetical protein [Corallococcus exiguus]NRD63277.1 hypothetical protein [Corallococcus exiguus]